MIKIRCNNLAWAISLAIALVFSNLSGLSLDGGKSAYAADLSQFDAGNIISDSKFFDGNSMSAQEVQNFMNNKVPNCTINNGQNSHQAGAAWGSTYISDVCLRDYFQQTPNMPAQPGYCNAYPGSARESAAAIIAKVGQICNISQRVLLVLLEKEQSLLTDSWPTVRQINQATGFACYDNGQPCVIDYAGFFYQVWSAARQFQRYGSGSFTWYPVGQVSNIAYQANSPSCGYKSVYIQNRATAALYYYTPYTPNDAALSAGYGLGDSCSAYGNRNFYQLYVDWFGTTQGPGNSSAIQSKYQELGSANSYLGNPIEVEICGIRASGCYREYQGGVIYYSPSTGAHAMKWRVVRSVFATMGYQNSSLGFPITDSSISGENYSQTFEGGTLLVSPANIVAADDWTAAIITNSWLGAPLEKKICGIRNNGCYQEFQNGVMYYTASTGAHAIKWNVIRSVYAANSYQNGALGFPTSDAPATGTTYTQTFEGGTVTVTNNNAAITSSNDPWVTGTLTNSWLGAPLEKKICGIRNNGCYQEFQNGVMYYTASTGAHAIKWNVIRSVYAANSYQNGALGFPTSDAPATGTTYTQTFEGGTVTVTNNNAAITSSNDPWVTGTLTNSWLGAPLEKKICGIRNNGCYQEFQNGVMYYTASTGAHAIKWNVIRSVYAANSYQNGALGFPTSDAPATGTTYTQTFEGGTVTVTNNNAAITSSNDPWVTGTLTNSWLGAPLEKKICGIRNNGCYQEFQNGVMYYTASTGAHAIKWNVIRSVYAANSYQNGALGFPTSDAPATGTTYTQTFEGGTVTVTNNNAAITSSNDPWVTGTLTNSWLGAPLEKKICGIRNNGCYQEFQNGVMYYTASTGAHAIKWNVIRSVYAANSYQNGALGFPTSDAPATGTTYTQTFQGGTVTVTNGVARIQ